MKKKLIVSILLFSLSLGMTACDYNVDTDSEIVEETENIEDDIPLIESEIYLKDFVDLDYIKKLSSYKNKDYEITINENSYTEEELFKICIPTIVYIENITEAHHRYLTGGNIYDVDEEYIYILSCAHGFDSHDPTTKIKITFFTNEIIEIPYEFVSFCEKDYSMYKIPKNLVSNETLNSIKSVNIDKFLSKSTNDFKKNTTLYLFRYNGEFWTTYYTKDFEYIGNAFEAKHGEIENGCSGFGYFDTNGTYYGPALKGKIYFYSFICYIEELLIQANSNYFDKQ